MTEEKVKRAGVIIEAAAKSGLVNGDLRGTDLIKFGLDHGMSAGYVIAWESYVAVIATPDDHEELERPVVASW